MKLKHLGIRRRVAIGAIATTAAAAVAVAVAVGGPATGGSPTYAQQNFAQYTATATFASPISASTDLSASVGEKLTAYAANTVEVDHATTQELIAEAGIHTESATHSGEVLDLDRAFTRETDNGSYVLRIPFVAKADLLDISGYTVMFNPNETVASRGEVVYEQQTEHSGHVALWQDGKLITDQVVSDGVTPGAANTDAQPAFNWNTFNQCLLNAGIAQWAIIAIGIACTVLCGGTAGVGCLVCVVAAGGVIGTTAGTCIARAMIS